MLKNLEDLAVGDWVVVESVILSRLISKPWKVVQIAKSRIHVERYDKETTEACERKFFMRKSIRFVFTDEAMAEAASQFARENSDEFEDAARALRKAYHLKFHNHMAALPRLQTLVAPPST